MQNTPSRFADDDIELDSRTFTVRTGEVMISVVRDGKEVACGGKMYFLKGLNKGEVESLQAEKDRDARWGEYSGYTSPADEAQAAVIDTEFYNYDYEE